MPFDATPIRQLPAKAPPAPPDPILDDLMLGRERIIAGWVQRTDHVYDYAGHRYCAVGAVGRADLVQHLYDALPLRWRLCPVPASRRTMSAKAVTLFNDAPWRAQRRVVRLFDRAIARRKRYLRKHVALCGVAG